MENNMPYEENLPITPEQEKENFENLLAVALSKKVITSEDLGAYKEKGLVVEDFLSWANREKGYVFHASGILIPAGEKLFSKRPVFYVTDDGGVAIIKALFANNIPGQTNLDYSLHKDGKQEVIISGKPEKEVLRERGYVYVVENEGFSNENTQGIAEYTKPLKEGELQDYIFVMEIEKSDFNYSYRIADDR